MTSKFTSCSKIQYLNPGEIFVTGENTIISTILGSCVAVCMWDKKKFIGGMNHIVLPETQKNEMPSTRFANVATIVLFDMLKKRGCSLKFLYARIFGGAYGIAVTDENKRHNVINVGLKNIEITLKILAKLTIPVLSKDLGGNCGRKILFNVHNGHVDLTYLKKTG